MRTIRISLAATAAAVLLVLAIAAPASAHDELVSSDPASGQRMPEAPASVSLSFSADVLTIGAAIIVVDQSGTDWAIGEPSIDAGTVTVALAPGMPDAGYEVRWRVVSADGHPVSGLVPFTVGDGSPLTHEDTSNATAASAGPTSSTPEGEGVPRMVLVGVIGGVIAAAVFFGIHFINRRRQRGTPETPGAQPGDRDTH